MKTARYSYQALRRRDERTVNLFRHDNIHPHEGQPTAHHRHRFDTATGMEIRPAEHIGESGWPNLGQVLDELHVYWGAAAWRRD